MSLQALKNINRNAPTDAEQPKGFPAMLDQFKGEIARALPKHINLKWIPFFGQRFKLWAVIGNEKI